MIKPSRMSWNRQVPRETLREFWWENLKKGDHLEDPSFRWDDIKIYLTDVGGKAGNRFICSGQVEDSSVKGGE
jgi:hypothetical protein